MHESPIRDNRPPARSALPFDQRLWPTILVLVAWAAAIVAVVVVAGDFDDPRPWRNGWVRLLTVAATLAALVWAVATIYPQRARRLKLAVVASLAAHSLLLIGLHEAQLELHSVPAPQQAKPIARDESPQEVFLPEYVRDPDAIRNRQEEFERPVASGLPTAAGSVPTRQQSQLKELIAPREPLAVRSDDSAPTTPPLQLRRPVTESISSIAPAILATTAAPRRSTASAMLPRAAVIAPKLSTQPRTRTYDLSASASPAPLLKRTARTAAAPVELSESPSFQVQMAPPPVRVAPRPTLLGPRPMQSSRSSLPPRQPRYAALPSATLRFNRDSDDNATETPNRRTAPAFAGRLQATALNETAGQPPGGTPAETDAAIAAGLDFLARVQLSDGRWSFDRLGSAVAAGSEPVSIRADAAATGLALLAFLGAGHDHAGGSYRHTADDAIHYLLRIQNDEGALFPEAGQPTGDVARFYGHGIATLALCEAYGMTGDPQLRRPAQRAIDYLAATQHDDYGGWRYVPGTNTDLSVTGWQLIALRSGRLAGLAVPPTTTERLRRCLEQCRAAESDEALYCYNPWASPGDPITRHGRDPSTVMTSVGLLMHLYLDAEPTDSRVRRGAAHLLTNLPRLGKSATPALTGTLGNPHRDTYYWYYGTQAMYELGGSYWETWRRELEPLLVRSQVSDGPAAGSWDPLRPVPDKWATYGGRLYVTAMNLLSLEVRGRHLPQDMAAPPHVANRPK